MKSLNIPIFGLLLVLLLGCRQNTTSSPIPPSPTALPAPTPTAASLPGSLYFIRVDQTAQELVRYDVAAETSTAVFTVPQTAWLKEMAVSPQGDIALIYAPPPEEGRPQYGFTGLYRLPPNGGAPEELLAKDSPEEIFFNPAWSPDGRMLYFSHLAPADDGSGTFLTTLERLDVTTGAADSVAANGIWPRLSPDGRTLAYVAFDPQTQIYNITLAEADGRNPHVLVPMGDFLALDAPLFSPDGNTLCFSAVSPDNASRSWWEIVLGIQTAAAHNLPSDWWCLPVSGGQPQRLTSIFAVGLYGAFSPDGREIGFAAQDGIYRMAGDGRNLEKWLDVSALDSFAWLDDS